MSLPFAYPFLAVAYGGSSLGKRSRVVVTADWAVSLDVWEATSPAKAVLRVVWRALLHLVIGLKHEGALV